MRTFHKNCHTAQLILASKLQNLVLIFGPYFGETTANRIDIQMKISWGIDKSTMTSSTNSYVERVNPTLVKVVAIYVSFSLQKREMKRQG